MRLSLTSWNINSVRLRIDLVARFLKSARPDVLCLQETKCIDDAFPRKRFRRLGYEHFALNGQKGYPHLLRQARFASHRGFARRRRRARGTAGAA
jgi:exonuclease III